MDGFLTEKQYLLEKIETLLNQNIEPNDINLLLDSFTVKHSFIHKNNHYLVSIRINRQRKINCNKLFHKTADKCYDP